MDFSIKTLSDGTKELYVDEKMVASGTQEEILPIMRLMTQHEALGKVSNDCWKTCPDSRYNRTKSEAIKEFIERLNDERYDRPIEIDCDGRCLNCEYYDTTDCPDRR